MTLQQPLEFSYPEYSHSNNPKRSRPSIRLIAPYRPAGRIAMSRSTMAFRS